MPENETLFMFEETAPGALGINPNGKSARRAAARSTETGGGPAKEAFPIKGDGPKGTTETAMAQLGGTRERREYLIKARAIARALIQRDGPTDTDRLFAVLKGTGRLPRPGLYQGAFWIGAVFNDPIFEQTGEERTPDFDPTRKAHAPRAVKLWRLALGHLAPGSGTGV